MQKHRPAIWFVVLLAFSSAVFRTSSVQAVRQKYGGPDGQESAPSREPSNAVDEATQLSRTVVTLFAEGKYEKALPLAKRALELRESTLEPDHELVQAALLNLAEVYTALKKYGDALKLVQRLLKTYEQKVGPDDAGAAVFLDKVGFLAYMEGDYEKSESAYKRALAIREKAFGQNSIEFAKSLFSLAEVYRFGKKPDKAEPLYEQSAILIRKLLGKDHPEYLKARDRFLCLAFEARDADKVKEFKRKLGDVSDPAVPAEVLNGRALTLPRPAYSEEARRYRVQGVVIIAVTIDEHGRVIEAKDLCGGNPLLVNGSLESARGARFTPTKLSGQPVKVRGVITYRFVWR